MDSLYLYFEMALDKVDLGLLCHCLREKRIWGTTGIWISDFLKNIVQKVLANNEVSSDWKSLAAFHMDMY